jgi:hypothetical protein
MSFWTGSVKRVELVTGIPVFHQRDAGSIPGKDKGFFYPVVGEMKKSPVHSAGHTVSIQKSHRQTSEMKSRSQSKGKCCNDSSLVRKFECCLRH